MGMVNGVRLINNLVSGATDATALQTQLGTASNYGSFVQALTVRSQANMALTSATPANAIGGSALGRQAVNASEQALSLIAPIGSAARPFFATSLYVAGRGTRFDRTISSLPVNNFGATSNQIFYVGNQWVTQNAASSTGVLNFSNDGGATWSQTTALYTAGASLQIASPVAGALFISGVNTDTSFNTLYRYTGSGNPANVLSTADGTQMSNVAFSGSVYVVAKTSSTSYWSSTNGTSWTPRTGIAVAGGTIAWCAGAGVFTHQAGSGATGATSPDGITWTSRSSQPTAYSSNPQIVASPTLFVMGRPVDNTAYSTVHTSPDGFTWTSRSLPSNIARGQLQYSQGMFFFGPSNSGATSGRNVFTYSLDGITWFEVTQRSTNTNDMQGYNPNRGEWLYMNAATVTTNGVM